MSKQTFLDIIFINDQTKSADIQYKDIYFINISMSVTNRKIVFQIFTFLFFTVMIISTPTKISIESVSLSPKQFIQAIGFEQKKTILYILGTGFNNRAKGTNVYLGPYECYVNPQQSTSNMIVCLMAPKLNPNPRKNLPLTIYMVNSATVYCRTNRCMFNYANSLTSQILPQQMRILNQDKIILKLTCTALDQYNNGGTECASCEGIDNSPGTATTNHKACNCNPSFLWNLTSSSCSCPKNSIISNSICFSCASLKTKYGTGLSNTDNTCQCKPTFTFSQQTNTCSCIDSDSFITSKGLCFSCTDLTINGTGSVNFTSKNSCECKSTYIWSIALNACICPNGSIVDVNAQCFLCTLLKGKNGTGIAFSNGTCQCLKSFIFSAENNNCICPFDQSYIQRATGLCISCENIGNSTQKADLYNRTCICNSNYLWNPAKNKTACLCSNNSFILENDTCFSCSSFKGKNGTGIVNKKNGKQCQCIKNLVFNSQRLTCQCLDLNSYIDKTNGLCVSCSSIGNGTAQANVTARKCNCKDSYVWTTSIVPPACVCASNSIVINDACFSCVSLRSKNSTGLVNKTDFKSCQCVKNFVFKVQTFTCECPDPNSYIDRTNGFCISCTNVGNGTGSTDVTARKCVCKDSYVWTPTLVPAACICLPNSFILPNNSCFLCASLKGKNGTGLVNLTDGASCQCSRSFVFKVQTGTCECPDPNSYIDKTTNNCVSCTGIGNGTGDTNITGRKCNCKDSYVWTTSIVPPACVCASNSIVINDACFSCVSLRSKNSTGLVNKTDFKSCQCVKNFVFKVQTFTCECPDPNSYIDRTNGFCISCTNVGNGTGSTDVTARKCVCKDSYVWTPTLVPAACICLPNSFILPNNSCFLCASLKGKNGTGLVNQTDGASCQCSRSFVFKVQTGTCECPDPNSYIDKSSSCVSCSIVGNGTGQADIISRKCLCKDTFVWNPSFSPPSCLCPANSIILSNNICFYCTSLRGRNGTGLVNATDNSLCACSQSFIFNKQFSTCQCPDPNSYIQKSSSTCVSCTGVGNGTGETDTVGRKCVCLDTYIWDPKLTPRACACPLSSIILNQLCFSCATLKGKNATGSVNTTDGVSCQCSRSFVFKPQTATCQCPDSNSFIDKNLQCVSCTNIGNGTGETDLIARKCLCKDTFVWTPNFSPPSCLCSLNSILLSNNLCFSCSTLKGQNSDGTINSTLPSACSCDRSYVFNIDTNVCQCPINSYISANKLCISCQFIENGTGQVNGQGTGCVCNENFVYNSVKNICKCLSPFSIVDGFCA